MDWQHIKKWDYIVVAVASEYHKKYEMIELDDIKQSLYEWFVEHPNKLNDWESLGEKDAKNLIYRSLRNQALDYCLEWKAKSVGFETADVFFYEAGIVEALLPSVLRKDFTLSHKLNLVGHAKPSAPAEGGNLTIMMIEIDKAYHKLNKEDKVILFYKYVLSFDYGEIASELKMISSDAVRMRHNRAVKKLINKIGGFRPWSDKDFRKKNTEIPDETIQTNEESESNEWNQNTDESYLN